MLNSAVILATFTEIPDSRSYSDLCLLTFHSGTYSRLLGSVLKMGMTLLLPLSTDNKYKYITQKSATALFVVA